MSLQNDGWKPLNVVLKPSAPTAMRSYSILFYNPQEDHVFKRSFDLTTNGAVFFFNDYEFGKQLNSSHRQSVFGSQKWVWK